jgi:hypothetical protein
MMGKTMRHLLQMETSSFSSMIIPDKIFLEDFIKISLLGMFGDAGIIHQILGFIQQMAGAMGNSNNKT